MCAKHLQEFLRDHRDAEAAAEDEYTSDPEERDRGYKEGVEEWEEQYQYKWEMLLELVQASFQSRRRKPGRRWS